MTIIRWHGRGGQGAFTAARLLGAAYSLENNRYALAFPSFGPERRGAPVHAFTKLDNKPIGNRSEEEKMDYIIFLDDTLFSETVFSELKPEGKILINTKSKINDQRVITLDGYAIAAKFLNMPITNTIMLGALAAIFDRGLILSIHEAIRQNMPEKLHKKNISAVTAAVEAVGSEVL